MPTESRSPFVWIAGALGTLLVCYAFVFFFCIWVRSDSLVDNSASSFDSIVLFNPYVGYDSPLWEPGFWFMGTFFPASL